MIEINEYADYWGKVQRNARISLDEVSENDDRDRSDRELKHEASIYSLQGNNLVENYPRTIIYYSDAGFYSEGYEIYIADVEFENNDSMQMINSLAQAAYYNDIQDAIGYLIERRESLGECMNLIGDHPIWESGVVFEYEYENGIVDPTTHDYLLECIGCGEWKMYNPEHEAFEVISPEVMVEDEDNPERALEIKLDNICSQELRDRIGE